MWKNYGKKIEISGEGLSDINCERLEKALIYHKNNFFGSNNNMYLTVEYLIEINSRNSEVLEIQLIIMINLILTVSLCIMLLNCSIIPVKDQKVDTQAIETNPLDKSEKVTCCWICKSIYQWTNNCPNKVKNASEDVNMIIFTQEMHECYIAKFVGEKRKCANVSVSSKKIVWRVMVE